MKRLCKRKKTNSQENHRGRKETDGAVQFPVFISLLRAVFVQIHAWLQ